MSTLTQIREIVLMNLRSIPQRLGASFVIVIGIGGVVGVLVAMLSMSAGLGKTLTATGNPNRAIILRGGSNGELASFIDRASGTLIKQDPAIARADDGLPLASGELIVVTEVRYAVPSGVSPVCARAGAAGAITAARTAATISARRLTQRPP